MKLLKMTKTKKQIKKLIRECKKYRYWYKWIRWIENYDIVTCIKVERCNSDNTKLFNEILLNLEVAVERMNDEMGKSQPWKAFKILLKTVKKISKHV